MATLDDLLARADVLGADAQLDLCTDAGRPLPDGDGSSAGIQAAERRYRHGDITRHITTAQGRRGPVKQLRVLQTNACAKDCYYCPFRAGRGHRREAYSPEELARLTDTLYRAGAIQGLFVSSGVVGHADHSMQQLVDTAEILRGRHGYRGFLHLKLMPAASDAAVERALAVADRVSINLEAPNPARLARLTSTKDLGGDLLAPLRRVKRMLAGARRAVSRTTQFVVGAAGESDREILETTAPLYRQLGLARVYYSAFRPVPDTPLESAPPEDPLRERRLYQADFLLRDYGFGLEELPLSGADGRLPLATDPKLAFARARPDLFPVEVNTADRWQLLRVPGIGPRGAARILRARRTGTIREAWQMRRMGCARAALEWVTLDGRSPARQLALPMD
jgi:predicted DNA-binding helix-hairpin-helix protein